MRASRNCTTNQFLARQFLGSYRALRVLRVLLDLKLINCSRQAERFKKHSRDAQITNFLSPKRQKEYHRDWFFALSQWLDVRTSLKFHIRPRKRAKDLYPDWSILGSWSKSSIDFINVECWHWPAFPSVQRLWGGTGPRPDFKAFLVSTVT